MPTFQTPPNNVPTQSASTGVLVVNLGTPSAPTTPAVRKFLKDFLSDPRVVEYPRWLWWLILNLVILRIRPARSAAAYREVWTDDGSPLMIYSEAIAKKLDSEALPVKLAMTYGDPSVSDSIDALLERGVKRILILPLYPQYSGTTTGAVFDAIARKLTRMRVVPEIQFINSYHDAPGYVAALASSVQRYWAENGRGDKLLMSFHGIPKSLVAKGDPYQAQAEETANLVAAELQLKDDEWQLSFQSRVGREEWLQPYTDDTVKALGAAGIETVDVICPGFATDCLETLEEIAMENGEYFHEAGGRELRYIAALNDTTDHIEFLAAVIKRELVSE